MNDYTVLTSRRISYQTYELLYFELDSSQPYRFFRHSKLSGRGEMIYVNHSLLSETENLFHPCFNLSHLLSAMAIFRYYHRRGYPSAEDLDSFLGFATSEVNDHHRIGVRLGFCGHYANEELVQERLKTFRDNHPEFQFFQWESISGGQTHFNLCFCLNETLGTSIVPEVWLQLSQKLEEAGETLEAKEFADFATQCQTISPLQLYAECFGVFRAYREKFPSSTLSGLSLQTIKRIVSLIEGIPLGFEPNI